MCQRWRPVFGWGNLCPILFADPVGLVVVMPRAEQPVTDDEIGTATPLYFPEPTYKYKPEDFGRVWSCPVSVDGLTLGSQAVIHRLRAGRFKRNRARSPVGNRVLAMH
jgi:hypothetical protein